MELAPTPWRNLNLLSSLDKNMPAAMKAFRAFDMEVFSAGALDVLQKQLIAVGVGCPLSARIALSSIALSSMARLRAKPPPLIRRWPRSRRRPLRCAQRAAITHATHLLRADHVSNLAVGTRAIGLCPSAARQKLRFSCGNIFGHQKSTVAEQPHHFSLLGLEEFSLETYCIL